MTPGVLPVVGGRVHHAEVGGGRVVEELGDLLEGERVGVGGPAGVGVGQLGAEPGEAVGRLVGEGIGARDRAPR